MVDEHSGLLLYVKREIEYLLGHSTLYAIDDATDTRRLRVRH
jgi:hypothetical protein